MNPHIFFGFCWCQINIFSGDPAADDELCQRDPGAEAMEIHWKNAIL